MSPLSNDAEQTKAEQVSSPETSTEKTFAGFVAIVGKPNVGKSTLLNTMLGVKVAPVTPKPQTTRRGIRGIATVHSELQGVKTGRQAVFIDTPGLHKPKDALGKYMRQEVSSALSDVEAVLWVVDLRRPPSEEDQLVARELQGFRGPLWLVGNKLDAAKYPDEAMRNYAKSLERTDFTEIRLSAQNDPVAVGALLEAVLAGLPESPFYFPETSKSDQSRENWAAEIVREEAMVALYEELPYSVATRVTEWQDRPDGSHYIACEIIVEKTAHRGIAIGAGGRMLKQIGLRARKQLEVFLNKKVFLDLEVTVIADWRRDPEALRELGYE